MGPSAAALALIGHLIQHTLALLGGDGLEDQQATTPMTPTAVSAQDPRAVQLSALQAPDIRIRNAFGIYAMGPFTTIHYIHYLRGGNESQETLGRHSRAQQRLLKQRASKQASEQHPKVPLNAQE